jgi:hypothetical protein
MVMYLCIHDETACSELIIDFFKKYQTIFHGAAVQIYPGFCFVDQSLTKESWLHMSFPPQTK